MSDRVYFFLFGLCLLIALYFESTVMAYVLIAIIILEGLTGITISNLTQKMRNIHLSSELLEIGNESKFNFEALRAWRLMVGFVILVSYVAVHEYDMEALWFFPWFLGFAVLGAGVSGICPVYFAFRWLGFK